MESISPSAPSNGLVVLGNYIGTDSAGDNLGNLGNGVDVWSDDVTIGGTARVPGNVIAYNGKEGILLVFSVDHNSFLSNSIYNNADLGINWATAQLRTISTNKASRYLPPTTTRTIRS